MAGYILTGSEENQELYIERYIKERAIPLYFMYRYSAPFSIKDARDLKKTLTLAGENEKERLVVIPSDMSLDAQNALLKTFEELPGDVSAFILQVPGTQLLPTLYSRLFLVSLENSEKGTSGFIEELFDGILSNTVSATPQILLTSNTLSSDKSDPFGDVLAYLREKMIFEKNERAGNFIESLYHDLGLYYSNNINKKMYWDVSLHEGLKSS